VVLQVVIFLPTFHVPSFYNKLHLVNALSSSFLHELKQFKQFTSAPLVECLYQTDTTYMVHVVCKVRNRVKEFSRVSLLYVITIYHSHRRHKWQGRGTNFPKVESTESFTMWQQATI